MGHFHRLLAQPADTHLIDLGPYLHEIARSAISAMSSPDATTLDPMACKTCELSNSQALLIGLIVGELVTNSVKYAHPAGVRGRIRVTCEPTGAHSAIGVEDDGVGFPEGFDPSIDGGLGLRTARLLADQLRATLTFRSGPLGVIAHLLVPAEPSTSRTQIHLATPPGVPGSASPV